MAYARFILKTKEMENVMPKSIEKNLYEAEYRICETTGKLNYGLIRFGDFIAKREKYNVHKGIDAIYYYLVQKYNWLPSQVKSMNFEDLRFVLGEEMHGWTLPKDAILED